MTGVQTCALPIFFAALTDLVSLYGEDAVVDLAKGLEKRLKQGEFTLNKIIH